MAITTLNQELWSTLLIKGTTEQIAYQEIVRNVGKVNGKTVHFSNIGSVTIGTYTKDTDVSTQTLTDSGIDLDLDQQKYFSVCVDDVDQAQSDAGIIGEVTRKGSAGLKAAIDAYIGGLHASAGITTDLGTTGVPIDINSANVLVYMRLIARKLNEANADASTRWIVVPPWFVEDLSIALPALDTNNSEMLRTGYVGMFSGLKVYMSNQVTNTTGAAYKIMAGDGDAMRFGMNIDKVEALRNTTQFGSIVRSLAVFGAAVVQSTTLALLTADPAAEA